MSELFSKSVEDQSTQQAPVENSNADQQAPFLQVGERIFGSKEDVVKKVASADEHIAKLEAERAADRELIEQLKARQSGIEQVLEEMKKPQGASVQSTEETPAQTQASVTEDTVRNLLQETLSPQQKEAEAKEVEQVYADNLKQASEAVISYYGSEEAAKQAVQKMSEATGYDLEKLAKESPKAFQHMMGIKPSAPSGLKADVNTAAYNLPKQEGPKVVRLGASNADVLAAFKSHAKQ